MVSDICRTCLETKGLLPIFGENNIIANMIMSCAAVEIYESDGFPMIICENCYEQLQAAYRFRRLCELSDLKLRKQDITNIDVVQQHLNVKSTNTDVGFQENFEIQESHDVYIELDQQKFGSHELYEEIVVADKDTNSEILSSEDATETSERDFCIQEDTIENYVHTKHHQKLKKRDQCPHCGKLFLGKGYLKSHILIHLGEKPHECDVCSKKFSQKCHLIRHMRTHTGDKPYQCKECGIKCANILTHQAVHNNSRTHICTICLRGFKSQPQLRSHEGIHTGVRNHRCHLCDKTFYKKSYLNVHLKATHLSEKNHKCTVCEKTFATSSNLKCHIRIHSGEQPYRCAFCNMKFNQSSSLTRHMKIHKQDPKQSQKDKPPLKK